MNAPETTFKWISILDKPEYLLSDLQLQNSFGLSYVKGKIHVLDFHQWQGLCDLSQPLHCSGDTLVGQPSDKVECSRSRHFQGLSPSERYSICLSRVTLSWRSDHRLFNIYCIKKIKPYATVDICSWSYIWVWKKGERRQLYLPKVAILFLEVGYR